MKKSSLILAALAVCVFLMAGSALASTVYLKNTGVNPSDIAEFYFPHYDGGSNVNVYTGQYDLAIDWDLGGPGGYEPIGGFCVEDTDCPTTNGLTYELLQPSVLGEQYIEAAWIFENYGKPGDGATSQIAAQAAIWEIVLDPGNYDLTTGSFHYVNGLSASELALAKTIISDVQAGDSSGFNADAGYSIARNPVGSNDVLKYQNYIIPYASSVPEPGTMLLLGTSLIGLAFLGRRNLFKK